MRSIVPILALGVVFAATGAVAQPMGRGHNVILSAPAVMTATPVPVPTVNSGALGVLPQQTIGAPIGNLGATAPLTPNSMLQNFGALPGEPGSATYDPNAALPSLGNEGSSIAPTPGTSDAGFNSPSVSSGTGVDTGTGR